MIKGSCDFTGGAPHAKITTLPSLVDITNVVMEIYFQWLESKIPHALP